MADSNDGLEWHLALASNDGDEGDLKLEGRLRLTSQEVELLQARIRSVHRYGASLHVAEAVLRNEGDILRAAAELRKRYEGDPANSEALMRFYGFEFARLIANLCSMFKSFIDHSERFLKKRYGKESSELAGWLEIASRHYDKNYAYAVISNMRNYIQHKDMPPIGMNLRESADEGVIEAEASLTVHDLMDDEEIKRKIGSRIQELPRSVGILQFVADWEEAFQELIGYVEPFHRLSALEDARQILSLRQEHCSGEAGRLVLMALPSGVERPKSLKFNIVWLPEDEASRVVELSKARKASDFETLANTDHPAADV